MWLKIIAGLILTVITLFTYWHFKQKYNEKRQRADFNRIFGDWKSSLPLLEFGAEYGRATFKVTFQNKNDFEFAKRNELTEEFKKCIESYYGKDFIVDIAVRFTYKDFEVS